MDPPSELVRVVDDPVELLKYGVCRVELPKYSVAAEPHSDYSDGKSLNQQDGAKVPICWKDWAQTFSQLTPEIMALEGDGEYAFYRNIMDESDFPFDAILADHSEIGRAIRDHFLCGTARNGNANEANTDQKKATENATWKDEIRLDDAFCVHYNTNQHDTSGSKHTDPSDITVNLCLEKSPDTLGSQVMFYGTKALLGDHQEAQKCSIETNKAEDNASTPFRFLVNQEAGYATIHWGDHPHETQPLLRGSRTNIVMTFCYSDPSRSKVMHRTCYF